MKKITLLTFMFLAFVWQGYSQASGYVFSQSLGTYTALTGGTFLGTATNDDTNFNANPIGFTFNYAGTDYTQFSVNSNGFIAMGATVVSSYTSLSSGTSNNVIAALNRDLQGGGGSSQLSYLTTGTAPNRVLTVEFKNYKKYGTNGTGDDYNFQIKLNETTNVVEIVYGTIVNNANVATPQVGLRGVSNASFNNRTTTTDWSATTAGTTNAATCTLNATIFPVSGRTFSWAPPSCVAPSGLASSVVLTTTATLSWNAASPIPANGYQYVYSTTNTVPTGLGTPEAGLTVNLTGLSPATTYYSWVRSDCGGGSFSAWTSSITFTTACNTFTAPFTEGFSSTLPNCWTNTGTSDTWKFANTGSGNHIGNNGVITGSTTSGGYFAWVDDSGSTSPDVTLTSPFIDVSALTTPRLTFFELSNNEGFLNSTLNVSVWDGAAWNQMAMYNTNTVGGWEKKIINLSSLTITGPIQIRFVVTEQPSDFYDDIAIDDVTIEETPAIAPVCASNFVATPNASCGNEATVITWDAAANADGYRINLGTATGTTDVLNNVDLGSVLTYNHIGAPGTNYYYTITPYNAVGSASGCTENTYTTVATGCYCPSTPTSVDGDGITNVQIVTTDFTNTVITSPVYNDHTATPVDMSQGINNNVQITFSTGFGYGYSTVIWIDANDDYIFNASEIVYTGESTNIVPTTLNASFVLPGSISLGQHRMRIVASDIEQLPSNPCYSGTYGESADFTINVVAASCAPVTYTTTTIVPDCANSQFSIAIDVTSLGSGTPSITDGTTTWPITAVGIVNVGPFASGSSHTLTVLHGSDVTCDLSLGAFTYICPPVNDNCSGATVLTVNPDYSCAAVSPGTVVGATDSGLTNSTCFGTEDDDVWYSFVATSTAHRISILNAAGSTTDMYHVLYDGTGGCAALGASLLCSDADVSNPTGLVIGNTYYVQVYTYTSTPNQTTTFNVCVGTQPTCYVPTALSAVFAAPTSANISWTAPTLGNTPAGYNWEIVPQGNAQGVGVVASGNSATTSAVATGLTVSTLYDLYVQTNCGGSDQSAWAMVTFITDYCLPSGTSASTYIDNFSTTLGATNITNNASGFSPANYGNFTTLSTSVGSTQSFNFNVEIVGGTAGCAIWVDWNNDYSFDAADMVYSTTSYGNGPFTGTITVPAATPNGNYRMRVMTDWNDSNPGDDNACGFGAGRGEVEDYIVTVDNALASQYFDNKSFAAYPNPVKDVLNLSYSTDISSVRVINLLGQEVISRKVENTSTQLDMTNLTAGAYIVNVTIGDVVKTIKVIKQ